METVAKFRKKNKNSSSCVDVHHKTYHQEISRRSRAVTVRKCTKKCNTRAELLFWLLSILLFDVLVAVAVVVASEELSIEWKGETKSLFFPLKGNWKHLHAGYIY